ncbi:MAG: trimeric intracellular cation channel family protein [Oscillospiraceae bacterium]
MELLIQVIEWLGTAAFSISGAVVGMRKDMDIFGILILGAVTAVGGGIIRDLMIGITPPKCFQSTSYLAIAIVAAVIALLPFVRKRLLDQQRLFNRVLFLMDAIGLAVFTVIGIRTAMEVSTQFSWFLLVFVGVLTGTGGGVLRDLFAGKTPYIFVRHIYATASLAGAICYLILHRYSNEYFAILLSIALIFGIRCLSAKFKWNLPKAPLEPMSK